MSASSQLSRGSTIIYSLSTLKRSCVMPTCQCVKVIKQISDAYDDFESYRNVDPIYIAQYKQALRVGENQVRVCKERYVKNDTS